MKKINATLKKITKLNYGLMEKAQDNLDNLTKPLGSLGRLEELAKLVVGITGRERPNTKNKVIFTLAADHGVTAEGISAYPKEVTAQMVYNFLNAGAGINVLARHAGIRVVVVDIGVASDLKANSGLVVKKINYGTQNMAKTAAMTKEEAIKSIETGIDIFNEEFSAEGGSACGRARGIDIVGTGEMGIGNTTASSAITACFTKVAIAAITGKGAGLDDRGLSNKIKVIEKSLALNSPDANDPIDVLAKVGGFEIGGIAGIILAAAAKKVPIVIDGFISGAGALMAYKIEPKVKEYMIASHCSVESGHKIILEHIGLKPLLNLNLRLGEGTGAALGINLVEAAVKILTEMATFKSANVSERTG